MPHGWRVPDCKRDIALAAGVGDELEEVIALHELRTNLDSYGRGPNCHTQPCWWSARACSRLVAPFISPERQTSRAPFPPNSRCDKRLCGTALASVVT